MRRVALSGHENARFLQKTLSKSVSGSLIQMVMAVSTDFALGSGVRS
jgi:hypothetical protein